MFYHSDVKFLSCCQLLSTTNEVTKAMGKLESWKSVSWYGLYNDPFSERPWISKFEIGGGNKIAHFMLYVLSFSRKIEYWFNHHEYYSNLHGDRISFCLLMIQAAIFRCHLAVTIIFLPVFLRTEDVNEIHYFRSKQLLIFLPNLKLTAICSWIRKWGVGFLHWCVFQVILILQFD